MRESSLCRDVKDAICVAKNSDADAIYAMLRNKKETKLVFGNEVSVKS